MVSCISELKFQLDKVFKDKRTKAKSRLFLYESDFAQRKFVNIEWIQFLWMRRVDFSALFI